MLVILLLILLIAFLGSTPTVGIHSYGWGPSGLLGVVLVILVIWLLLGRF
jgi:hypothetical protein